ncbi:hypothetical protein [Kineosporia sp. NBRC 101731]|uniref:hypothetical protein n=1 Tax=Kineosporia sp. NBRC 101731 TaxID=3032199 RepID=UPI0024A2933B|nr:hypothetical protein [Kineosporia sp. NBRC 101731]GLY32264.1 hypothetical protein Kisp02_56290 [Kineosporia sp. NBRC 101731]
MSLPRVLGPISGVCIAVGIALQIFPYEFSFWGPILLSAGFLGVILCIFWEEGTAALISTLIIGVGICLVISGVAGLVLRTFDADSYRYRYGDRVTVQGTCPQEEVPDKIYIRRRGSGGQATETCPATWTLDGRQIKGEVKFASSEKPASYAAWTFTMPAYALGDRASGESVDLDKHYGVTRYSVVPLWVSGVGIAVILVVLGILNLFSAIRSRRSTRVRG